MTVQAASRLISPLTAQSGDTVEAAAQQGALEFWSTFRAAVIARDGAKLASMSAQPLEIRGEVDSDPVRKIAAADLPSQLLKLLDSEVFAGTGQPPTALRELIIETVELPDRSWVAPTQLRVHNLVFGRSAAGVWQLTLAYAEEN